MENKFTDEQVEGVARGLDIDWSQARFDLNELKMGMNVELEHGLRDPKTNVTNDDFLITGKIALAHLMEYPDYYQRLGKMEREAEEYWNIEG